MSQELPNDPSIEHIGHILEVARLRLEDPALTDEAKVQFEAMVVAEVVSESIKYLGYAALVGDNTNKPTSM